MKTVVVELKEGQVINVMAENTHCEVIVVDHDYEDLEIYRWPQTQWSPDRIDDLFE